MDLTSVEYTNIIVTSTVGYVHYKGNQNYMKYSKENQTYGQTYTQCNGKQMDATIPMKQYLILKNNFGNEQETN